MNFGFIISVRFIFGIGGTNFVDPGGEIHQSDAENVVFVLEKE